MSDSMLLSELYGKQILTNTGKMVGGVEDIVVDFEEGKIASLLLVKSEELIRSDRTSHEFAKNSVRYDRVKNVDQMIIVSGDLVKSK
jgi:sporulation protein YlmC with PRC-barrel domain